MAPGLACFKAGRGEPADNASEVSSSAASSAPEPTAAEDNVIYVDQPTVNATKQHLKRLLRKEEKNQRALMNRDPEFRVLAKLFGEENATPDMRSLSMQHPESTMKLLPFMLNMLLYGFGDDVDERSKRFKEQLQEAARGRKKGKDDGHGSGHTALTTASQLQRRGNRELELEDFVYSLCQRSVHFALKSSWYFTSSLILGPEDMYHRTMSLLLGMESVVTTDKKPGDLFKRSEIEAPQSSETSELVLSPRRRGRGTKANTMTTTPAPITNLADGPSDPGGEEIEVEPATEGEITDVVLESTGEGGTDIHLQFKDIGQQEKDALQMWLAKREDRGSFFHAELDFIKCLTDVSRDLFDVPREHRKEALRAELDKLNEYLPKNVFLPTETAPHKILRIVASEACPHSTKERCPYSMIVEVEDIPPPEEETPDSTREKKHRRRRSIHLEEKNYAAEKFKYQTNVADSNTIMELESKKSLEPAKEEPQENAPFNGGGAFGEPWAVKSERLRKVSPHGSNPNWRLTAVIVKAKDKLRQEMFASSLVQEFDNIFRSAKLPLWVFPYGILATSADSGLIEFLKNSKSIDSIKKDMPGVTTLADVFRQQFGDPDSASHKKALRNFTESMAGYSVLCYVLQIKDRHNGNLMLDSSGRIVHIDFGFLLSNSPGGNFEFEKAPFKLTAEMLEVLGGPQSNTFKRFRKLCNKGYIEVCKHRTKLLLMVDMFYQGNEGMPCFSGGREAVLERLRDRLCPGLSSKERKAFFNRQINAAIDNWTTKWYDRYQKCFTGIAI